MDKRRRVSTIDELPDEIKKMIGEMLRKGITQKTILETLNRTIKQDDSGNTEISKSALSRHCKSMEEITEAYENKDRIVKMWIDKFGNKPDTGITKVLLTMINNASFELILAAQSNIDDEGNPAPTFDSKMLLNMAQTLQRNSNTELQTMRHERACWDAYLKKMREAIASETKRIDNALSPEAAARIMEKMAPEPNA